MAPFRPTKLVLTPSYFKPTATLFAAALAGVCGVGIALDAQPAGWIIAVLAILVAAAAWRAFTSPRLDLRLNQSGFAFGTLVRRHAFSWCDVQSFSVIGFGRNRLVAVTLVAGMRSGRLTALGRRISGFDCLLTDTYGLAAHELAGLLESWRKRYGKRDINPMIVPPEKIAVSV